MPPPVTIPAISNTWTPANVPSDSVVEGGSGSQPVGLGSAKMSLNGLVGGLWDINHFGGSLDATVTALGATKGTIVVSKPVALGSNVTVPATATLRFVAGGIVTTTGWTLTINGYVDAGAFQIFAGSGSVVGLGYALPEWWGVTGTADDVAINNAIAAVQAKYGMVQLQPTTYNTVATVTVKNASLRGVYWATIIKPSAAVVVCIDMLSPDNDPDSASGYVQLPCLFDGIKLNGTLTTSAVGIRVAYNPGSIPAFNPSNGYRIRNFKVMNFAGANAKGVYVTDAVSFVIENGDVSHCYDGLYFLRVNTGNIFPTTASIRDVYTHFNTNRGIHIGDGFGLNFSNVYSEANAAEGVYITCAAGNTAMLMQFDSCQFEGNWSGSSDITKFGVLVLGSPGFVNARFVNCLFASYGGGEIHVTDAFVLIDNPQSSQYTNASFVFDGSSDVYLQQLSRNFNWGGIIDDNTVSGRVVWEGYIADLDVQNVIGAWTDWTPIFSTPAGMTFTSINLQYARYKIVGKTCHIELSFDGTVAGVPAVDIYLTFPAAIVPKRNDFFTACPVTPADPGYIAEVRTYNPSGNGLYVRKYENWSVGAGRGARLTMTFELA